MSEEYRDLADRINRMQGRKERVITVIKELEAVLAEVDTDMKALELRRDGLAAAGDSLDQ